MRYNVTQSGYEGWADPPRRVVFPRLSPVVRWLILANVAVFLVQLYFESARRVSLSQFLGVVPRGVIERLQVWQVVTYMFLHSTSANHVIHIVVNMLFLYWFGVELERVMGRGRFLGLYLAGGVAGGVAYAVTQYLVRMENPAIGASAAVMALLVVYAFHFPNRTVYLFYCIPLAVKWFVLAVIAMDVLYSANAYGDGVAHTAHLGGALYGLLYWRLGPRLAPWLDRFGDRHRDREARRRAADEQRVDDLLVKISREGFDSLSRRERDFLTEQSRRRRERGYRS
ncbi:MAG TPA: rhomboid family intramembrane serine protease [Planctomycetota bacterium]|nr:rhomboid family intramembrane serine protease [Planctomycetota bacterium]HRR79783.1 rhomboid family intramembrane serine protease [Planctomycetota bacterium]HRT96925.1 rhomboid family intramembrane serine protease [Planctomycetota bacterium]